ncbi:MAG: hypothetical protein DWQ37_07060 [Planctomycetota bacterium]|nr:MAG: hypothetical protein DWQ37_07060 [Planctomycetota bacterium]
MRFEPPPNLTALFVRLKLATPEQLASAAPRAARLAGDLPDFESVWVDALAQMRVLSPYQAAEINAGRGEALLVGPYVVVRPLAGAYYADCYAARHAQTGRQVRLYVVRANQTAADAPAEALAGLVAQSAPLAGTGLALVEDCGVRGKLIWAATAPIEGTRAADWMVENGRLPPRAVLHAAREMTAMLSVLEANGLVHGDLGAGELFLQASGHVTLGAAGLRGAVRPHEGYSFGELHVEAYDYLAPERIAAGSPPTTASDLYACGCLWTHLLTGRAPFPGGNSLSKLKAVHAARPLDVRLLAPEVPDALAAAIEACLARDPASRPQSFAEVGAMLGPTTRGGAALLAQLVRRPQSSWQLVPRGGASRKPAGLAARVAVAAATAVILVGIALAPWIVGRWSSTEVAAAPTSSAPPDKPSELEPPAAEKLPDIPETLLPTGPLPTPSAPVADPEVQPAAAVAPTTSASRDIVLPAGRVLHVEQLDLRPHVRVRGRAGRRPLVSVPRRGLVIDREGVTFEGIDFIWEAPPSTSTRPLPQAAMLVVEAQTVAFRGCSFSSESAQPPHALLWAGANKGAAGLPGELAFFDCVFDAVASVVDCRGASGCNVRLENALCRDAGPVVRLHDCPADDAPVSLVLTRVTTRGESPVLECRYGRMRDKPGRITITAHDSALAGSVEGGLVVLRGAERPETLAAAFAWGGQGTIMPPETSVVVWRAPGSSAWVLDEAELEVAGLVRGALTFAGPADGPPTESRVTRWQVPLRSPDPPGADPHPLTSARR